MAFFNKLLTQKISGPYSLLELERSHILDVQAKVVNPLHAHLFC